MSCQCLLDLPDIPVKAPRQAVKPVCHMTCVVNAGNRILGCCDDNTGGEGRGGGGKGEGRGEGRERRKGLGITTVRCSAWQVIATMHVSVVHLLLALSAKHLRISARMANDHNTSCE